MTTLFWCMSAIAIAILLSRYHQSNKLFWILFTSFLLGIAGVSVYGVMSKGSSNDKDKLTQVCPTQGAFDASGINLLAEASQVLTTSYTKPNLVSKDYTPAISELSFNHQWTIPTHTPPPRKLLL